MSRFQRWMMLTHNDNTLPRNLCGFLLHWDVLGQGVQFVMRQFTLSKSGSLLLHCMETGGEQLRIVNVWQSGVMVEIVL